jgi:hypothetical protein
MARALQMSANPLANISSPLPDQILNSSNVTISGSAESANFSSYSLKYGQGLYPINWVTLATSATPVTNGTLGVLDTTNLTDNRAYTIRLYVSDTAGNTSITDSYVYLQKTVQAGWPQTVSGTISGESLAIGDVDLNGTQEIAVRISNPPTGIQNIQDLALYKSDGTQMLGWPKLNLGKDSRAAPTLADVTGDGNLEVIFQTGSSLFPTGTSTFHVFNFNGDYISGWPQTMTSESEWLSMPAAVGDIDGDGKSEIVFASHNSAAHYSVPVAVKIFIFRFDGTPLPGWPKEIALNYPNNFFSTQYTSAPSLVDLDNDGKLEIVLGISTYPSSKVYAFKSDGSLVNGWPFTLSDGYIENIVSADVDNDGTVEIIGTSSSTNALGSAYIWKANGTVMSGWPRAPASSSNPPIIMDIESDGNLEVAFYTRNDAIAIYRNNGTAVSGWPLTLTQKAGGAIWPTSLAVDFSGDSKPEIIQASGDENLIYAFQSDGSAVNGWPKAVPALIQTSPAVGDLDNDGMTEMALAHGSTLSLWELGSSYNKSKLQWPMSGFNNNRSQFFSLADSASPIIRNISITGISSSSATVQWDTSKPADSQVEYGTSTSYGSFTAIKSLLSTAHSEIIGPLAPGTLYHFRVRSRDSVGNLSISADMTFNTNAAPFITTQPTNQAVTLGQSATFSVVAGGTATLNYQWRKNTVAIAGANSANYTTPSTLASDNNSSYSVIITNVAGSITSANALLTVNSAPSITSQPISQTVNLGQTATFSVSAGGSNPLSYQWRKNTIAIVGATAASYTTPVTTASDNNASYTVTVSNAAGSQTSVNAVLTLNFPPTITSAPVSQTVNLGQSATFSVSATGTNPLNYQWRKNTVAISGATAASYTTPATTASDNNASYSVVVTNLAGSVTSSNAIITIRTVAAPPPPAGLFVLPN